MQTEELLKYAVENGIIDTTCIQEQVEMNKRKEYLIRHPWSISQGSDGKWRTYLPGEGKSKRKMVKRNDKKSLEDAIIEFYKEQEKKQNPKTFDDAYQHWRSVQDILVTSNTVTKYNTDYKRYFKDTDFSRKNIEHITEEDIKVFIVKTVKTQQLCKKACKTLFGYVRNTINSARINKMIYDDPMEFLQAKQFYKHCTENIKPQEKQLVSELEMKKLYQKFKEDYKEQPNYIPTYAVHFASLTGMRVGEISALTWDCVTEKYILINKSEKYNRETKEYYIGKTKNGRERIFPMTEKIRDLLEKVKRVEMQNGYMCEWVFANENGRIHAPVISSCSKNKCKQVGIEEKGIHAYRRTVNSKLRCNGVSATVAASLLGHTEEVNEKYYTFDVTNIEEKEKIVSGLDKFLI